MKRHLIGYLVACLLPAALFATTPETIAPKIKSIRSLGWYQEQAELWQAEITRDRSNLQAWLNFYTASRYGGASREHLNEIAQTMISVAPKSFESILVQGLQQGYTLEAYATMMTAFQLNQLRPETFGALVLLNEMKGDLAARKMFSEKLFQSGQFAPSLLHYSYNVLMSVEPGSILITENENTSLPLYALQDVLHIRDEVKIIQLELFADPAYRNHILSQCKLTLRETSAQEEASAITLLPVQNPTTKFYYALTLTPEHTAAIRDQLYVVGLASQHSMEPIDNLSRIQENLENKFLLDYLTVDFNGENQYAAGKVFSANYLVPMLLMYDHYVKTNEREKAAALLPTIQRLAKENSKEQLVANFLARSIDIVPYYPSSMDVKSVEGKFRKVTNKLLAQESEVTNLQYNTFLAYLKANNLNEQYEKFKFDLSAYEEPGLSFMKGYSMAWTPTKKDKKYTNHPAVNMSYEGAVAYCEWLTDQYNHQEGRKYKQVKFRLPTIAEWQIAALGYPKFTSWVLDENSVEVWWPKNNKDELSKEERTIPVKGNDILYPWYKAYNYRNTVLNSRGCSLGNYKFPEGQTPCVPDRMNTVDGYVLMAAVESYFPNGMGLYDVSGNVAEMIDEKGKACGGSWNASPEESTIRSVGTYNGPDSSTGFRVFMEVIQP